MLDNGEIYGPLHPANRMEAIGVGIATAMGGEDFFCPARRTGIPGQITRGMELKIYVCRNDGPKRWFL